MIPDKIEEARKLAAWQASVLGRYDHECANCERKTQLWVAFLVPPECGGKMSVKNGVVLCRKCKMDVENHRVLPAKIDDKTPVNFLISRELHQQAEDFVRRPGGVGTISSLVRNMVTLFVSAPDKFEDLHLYQSDGSEVKINLWCPGPPYERMKSICSDRGVSLTDTFKALIMMAIANNHQ